MCRMRPFFYLNRHWFVIALLALAVGCAEGSVNDGGGTLTPDSGADAATPDAGPTPDAADAATDAQTPGDAGPDAPAGDVELCVLGDAGPEGACAADETLAFGQVSVGATEVRAFRLDNRTGQSAEITSASFDQSSSQLSIEAVRFTEDPVGSGNYTGNPVSLPADVADGESLWFEVTLQAGSTPGGLAASEARVEVDSAAGAETQTVAITGEVTGCAEGTADCDGRADNGCEINTDSNPNHCGGCNTPCQIAGGVGSCVQGQCQLDACNAGFDDCDGDLSNGCETDLTTSLSHCGGCGNTCDLANSGEACVAGSCEIATCSSGFQSCDNDDGTGCETNTQNDSSNCGACGFECSFDNASASCDGGACDMGACDSGWEDCDSAQRNGCEANIDSDRANCGACGVACSNPNGTTTCNAGSCDPTCDTGWDDCNGDAADGCETEVQSLSDCGACGVTCDLPGAQETCSTGVCEIDECNNGFCDADGNSSNGCEADLDVDPVCNSATDIGSVNGDTGSQTTSTSAYGEQWFKVRVAEGNSSGSCVNLGAEIELTSPSGTDYDLDVYCDDCNNSVDSSYSTGAVDTAHVEWPEGCVFGFPDGSASGRDVYIRVKFYSGSVCTDYDLVVRGNVFDSAGPTCSRK